MDPEQRRQGLDHKHNDYESGAFNLLAGSPGGRSLLPAEDLPSADALNTLFLQYGLYKYPARLLNAIMRGHNIDINIDLGERSESISCSSTRCDAEIAFQFFHLTVVHPRFSRPDFDKYVRANKIQRTYAKPTTRRLDSLRHARAAHPAVAPHPQNGYGLLCGDGLRPDGGNLRRAFPQRCRFRFLSRR